MTLLPLHFCGLRSDGPYVPRTCGEPGRSKASKVSKMSLTEMGDCLRFCNRRKVGSYLGLAPTAHESGVASDRKGHITHQGPAVVRKMLCQAVWCRNRCDAEAKSRYDRIVKRNPKHKKIAVVAMMRQLAVKLWHRAVEVLSQRQAATHATG